MLLSTQTPTQLPLRSTASPCTPNHPWQSSGCLLAQQKGAHGCFNGRPDPFVHVHGATSPRSCTTVLFLARPPQKEAAYGAAALAPWQILIPAVTKCDKEFANDSTGWQEPSFVFLGQGSLTTAAGELDFFCSSCGKAIRQMIIRESEGVQNRVWLKECL